MFAIITTLHTVLMKGQTLLAQVDPIGQIDIPGDVPTDVGDLENVIRTVITAAWSLGGVLAVVFVIIAGYKIIISSGDPQEMKKGQDTLMYAVAGLVVIVVSGLLVNFIARLFGISNLIMFLKIPVL